jgi:hypothetical protein
VLAVQKQQGLRLAVGTAGHARWMTGRRYEAGNEFNRRDYAVVLFDAPPRGPCARLSQTLLAIIRSLQVRGNVAAAGAARALAGSADTQRACLGL